MSMRTQAQSPGRHRLPPRAGACRPKYLQPVRIDRNWQPAGYVGGWIVPWKGTGRRGPRMRYSGTTFHLAQSSLTAPFCCQRRDITPRLAVSKNPTELSVFSRLYEWGASGVECCARGRALAWRQARRGCWGIVKGGSGGVVCRPSLLGYGGRSRRRLGLLDIMGRQGCCVWSCITS
jgi:hypothetical protein